MIPLQNKLLEEMVRKHLTEAERHRLIEALDTRDTGFKPERYIFNYIQAIRHGIDPSYGDPVGAWLASNATFHAFFLLLFTLLARLNSPWFYLGAVLFLPFLLNSCAGLHAHRRGGFLRALLIALVTAPLWGINAIITKTGLMRFMQGTRP